MLGDEAGCERELRESHRLYSEMGATSADSPSPPSRRRSRGHLRAAWGPSHAHLVQWKR